jgi:hypothetical protein
MRPFFVAAIVVVAAIVLDRSLLPLFSVWGSSVLLSALVVVGLGILGFVDRALFAAVLAGTLLDLLSAGPFGHTSLPLGVVLCGLVIADRLRLLAPAMPTVAITMAAAGFVFGVFDALASREAWSLLLTPLLYAAWGIILFPFLVRLFPKKEVVKV